MQKRRVQRSHADWCCLIFASSIRAVLHDDSVFQEPSQFRPERFLDPNVKLPEAVYGFGRRICPGRFMARSSIWITIASVLAAFEIAPITDHDGVPQVPKENYTPGIIS